VVQTGLVPLVLGNGNGEAMVEDGMRQTRYAQLEERKQYTI